MYYLLFYTTVDDYVERRIPYREQHLAYAKAAYDRGEIVMGGPLSDPVDGAVLIFRGESPAVAEEFAKGDPYVRAGLIREWRVRPWRVVFGG
ncbi:MAG: YciI family protein [Acidobacteria bacterium]|nr:YciI family protein [Acidobacteriota bacterium]